MKKKFLRRCVHKVPTDLFRFHATSCSLPDVRVQIAMSCFQKNTKQVARTLSNKQVLHTQWIQGTRPTNASRHYDYGQQEHRNGNNRASLKPSGNKSIHVSKARIQAFKPINIFLPMPIRIGSIHYYHRFEVAILTSSHSNLTSWVRFESFAIC